MTYCHDNQPTIGIIKMRTKCAIGKVVMTQADDGELQLKGEVIVEFPSHVVEAHAALKSFHARYENDYYVERIGASVGTCEIQATGTQVKVPVSVQLNQGNDDENAVYGEVEVLVIAEVE